MLYVSIYTKSHTFSSTEYRVIYGTHIQCLYLCFLFLCRIFLFHFYLNSSSSGSIGSYGSSISISGWLCGTVDLSAICVYFQCLGQFVYAAFMLMFSHMRGTRIGFYGMASLQTHIIQFILTYFQRLMLAMQTYCINKLKSIFVRCCLVFFFILASLLYF